MVDIGLMARQHHAARQALQFSPSMNYTQFRNSLSGGTPPEKLSELLLALWHEARGDWDKAHDIVQDIHTSDASWIHAYLHRREGDAGNAAYWYQRAGRKFPDVSMEEEWEELVKTFTEEL